MNLQDLTWPDIDAYLKKSKSIIVPIGSTEQHGQNGVIGTDAMVAEAAAKGMGALIQVLATPEQRLQGVPHSFRRTSHPIP